MPRLSAALPKYRLHRASGQAVVNLYGRDYYLGPHGTKASRLEYDRRISEWLASGRLRRFGDSTPGFTLVEVFAAYKRFAEGYYRKNGKVTNEATQIVSAMTVAQGLYGRELLATPLSPTIVAYVELEEYQEASRIVEELFAQQRPDWKTTLAFWEGEIADRQGNYGPVEEVGPLQVAILPLAGPLWARVEQPAGKLFPKAAEAVVICCQAATVQMDASRTTIEMQKPDASGRFTRVAPLLLVEQIHAGTTRRE